MQKDSYWHEILYRRLENVITEPQEWGEMKVVTGICKHSGHAEQHSKTLFH